MSRMEGSGLGTEHRGVGNGRNGCVSAVGVVEWARGDSGKDGGG